MPPKPKFTREEMSEMLTQDFTAMMMLLRRGMVKMRIETERLILRPYREEDLQDLYEYVSDEEVVHFEPYLPMDISGACENLAWRISTNEMIAVALK